MFRDDLEKLLREAVTQEIVTFEQANRVIGLAPVSAPSPAPGFGGLAKALTLIGGFGLILGLILLIGANWYGISGLAKLGGFMVLFLATHLGGLWIRWKCPDYDGTAEALTFVGAGLFVGGVALVAQIFHINETPMNGVLAWLVATLPLAFLLRSTPLFGMSLLAALIWGPWKFSEFIVKRDMDPLVTYAFAAVIPFAVLFIGDLVERFKHSMGTLCRVVASIMIGVSLYALGFFRHAHRSFFGNRLDDPERMGVWIMVFLGIAVVLSAGGHYLRPGKKRLVDHGYFALILATLAVLMLAAAIGTGWWELGEEVERFNFSGTRMLTFRAQTLLTTGLAWLLWFLWGVWLVFAGSAWDRNGLVGLGVYGIALGLVTRYFDLIGTLEETGAYFIVGGVVLILAGWGAETCRRRLTKKAASDGARS